LDEQSLTIYSFKNWSFGLTPFTSDVKDFTSLTDSLRKTHLFVTFKGMEEHDKNAGDNENQNEINSNELIALHNFLVENESVAPYFNTELIDPIALQFIPKNTWSSLKPMSIQNLRDTYFSKKNSVSRRFEHKLWNALRITSTYPNLVKHIGVVWVTDTVIKVYKFPFAKLLNISCVDGGLFHKQGNFTRHGFTDLSENEAKSEISEQDLNDVDYREVHLISHNNGSFNSNAAEESICNCRWNDPSPTTRVAALKIGHHQDSTLE